MPIAGSSWDTSQPYIPTFPAASRSKLPGVPVQYDDIAGLNTAVAIENNNVGVIGVPVWLDGQLVSTAAEAAIGVWRVWTRAAGHARLALLPGGLRITLASASNVVTATSGPPSGGVQGDVAIDVAAGTYYLRGASTWGAAQRLTPAGSTQWQQVAFSPSVPLTGSLFMPQTAVTGALTISPNLTGAVVGSVCTMTLVANGTNTPTFTGMLRSSGSGNWSATNGDVNEVAVWMAPNGRVYYSIDQASPVENIIGGVAPTITSQPGNASVASGSNATFSVTATGTAPLSYQWQRGGVNISGATSASYTITTVLSDNGAAIRCVVTNAFGSATSNAATLTVTSSDTTPPTLAGTVTASNVTSNSATLTWPAGTDNVGVTGYEYSTDGGSTYTSAGNVLTANVVGLSASTTYQLRVRARDAANNVSTAISGTLTTSSAGGLTFTDLAPSARYTESGNASAGFVWTLNAQTLQWGAPFAYANGGPAMAGDFTVELVVKPHNANSRQMLFISGASSNVWYGEAIPGAHVVTNTGGTGWGANFNGGFWPLRSDLPAPAAATSCASAAPVPRSRWSCPPTTARPGARWAPRAIPATPSPRPPCTRRCRPLFPGDKPRNITWIAPVR